jgi:REP element-mobilizing transposase RayT
LSHAYAVNLFHLVFSTKNREHVIAAPEFLWAYTAGIVRNIGGDSLAIGGTSNHVHFLLRLPPSIAISVAAQKIKANSSRWLRERGRWNGWQEGYGSFTVSVSNAAKVRPYILDQPGHHANRSFEEELMALLRRSGVQFEVSELFV